MKLIRHLQRITQNVQLQNCNFKLAAPHRLPWRWRHRWWAEILLNSKSANFLQISKFQVTAGLDLMVGQPPADEQAGSSVKAKVGQAMQQLHLSLGRLWLKQRQCISLSRRSWENKSLVLIHLSKEKLFHKYTDEKHLSVSINLPQSLWYVFSTLFLRSCHLTEKMIVLHHIQSI